ncbi:pirin family protein [Pseudomonas aeruginosa]|uniref:pirin family protein n=1 Tax=Pseudomonas aeruginosa TaxID=287 RepID=UPI00093C72E8|nr:pirin family protein [Pseudomonas aeruginosa]HBO1345079.1 pirin family protein [Pseudomonas aeruginosa]
MSASSTQPSTVSRRVIDVHDARVFHEAPNHLAKAAIESDKWTEHDPFLVMAEDRFGQGAFGLHPHRGMETITYVIDGRLDHEDNRGNAGSLGPRDVQLMTAGRGILHNEVPPPGSMVHTLQLWLNLPAARKFTEPRYQDLLYREMPRISRDGAVVTVYSGAFGEVVADTLNHTPFVLFEIDAASAAQIDVPLPGGYNGFVHVVHGAGHVGPDATPASTGQTLWLERTAADAATTVRVATQTGIRVLVVAGEPLNEPVVARGPFVMNTAEQIEEAYKDLRAGRFNQQ